MASKALFDWNLTTLNKAYRQGYMAGNLGMDRVKCPYRGDVVVAAWEAGWEDGKPEVGKTVSERNPLAPPTYQ